MRSRFFAPLFFALILFSVAPLAAQTPSWSQFSGSPGGTTRNDDVHFVDPLHGWSARGRDGIFATTNGGVGWTKVNSNLNPVAHFRCIGFASTNRGWAGNLGPGSYDTLVTDTNILYETWNGGQTWSNHPGFAEAGMKGLCAIHVFDEQTIYGAGRVRGPAFFIRSTDGGTNWFMTNLTTAGVMGALMDVYFHDKTNGFIVGMDTNLYSSTCPSPYTGQIARTTNGGDSWFVVATVAVPCSYFWKMSWPSPQIGYVSLQKNPTASDAIVYYKTTDGGATWSSNGIPVSSFGNTEFYWQGIGFVNTNEGWAGGEGSASPYTNTFLHTTNGGATWNPTGYNNSRSINRIRFLNPNLGFAAGQQIHVFRVSLGINASPTNQTVTVGSNVTMNAVAQGTPPLVYQWRFNVTNVVGTGNNTIALANVQFTNAGKYDVVVSDYSGSLTSAVATLTVSAAPVAPTITTPPQSLSVNAGQDANFSVTATGTTPLAYQWRYYDTNLSGATQTGYTRANAQLADAGNYSVVVTNSVGSITSIVATLTVVPATIFEDNFDSYVSPSTITAAGTNNGYRIVYRALSGAMDFKAIFGFNYSTVTYPTNIPSAPHSIGGTTKGLYLTVNKDANGQPAAVNLYPTNQFFSGNFALKFDLWINWRDIDTSTEHALFGINHSGNVTNRIGVSPSDGLFFAVEGEDDSLPDSTTLRDYSAFRGGGTPVLMTTNNTTFGPAPLLAPQFENYNPGFVALFPSQTIPGYGTTPAGSAGLRWLRGEVRQLNKRITWLLNDTVIAQYTNLYAYTNGNIMLGYNDNFPSTGDSNNFAIFDNLRVEYIVQPPVKILSPQQAGTNFSFSFATDPYEYYTVQSATNLTPPVWADYTNFLGNGNTNTVQIPLMPSGGGQQYFRVRSP